ncbi:MAG: hypothetical protein HKL96_12930 [Phycisphaerales bacterium]|nr:hypothetical protein [Phycisphaerales bacterium]
MVLAIFCLLALGCGELENYPPGQPGWHTPDYTVVFGRLEHSQSTVSQWVLRYESVTTPDPYGGKFLLSPTQMFNCLVPGDQIEVIGKPMPKAKPQAGAATTYQVKTVYYWLSSGRRSVLTR